MTNTLSAGATVESVRLESEIPAQSATKATHPSIRTLEAIRDHFVRKLNAAQFSDDNSSEQSPGHDATQISTNQLQAVYAKYGEWYAAPIV